MEETPSWLRPDGPVMRLHRKNLERRRIGLPAIGVGMKRIKRPTTGDRMDNSNERTWRRSLGQSGQAEERAEYLDYETRARVGKRQYEDTLPYDGSKLESEHRDR